MPIVIYDPDDYDPYLDDPAHYREPDPSDYEEARAQEEYWQHCDDQHAGKECTCPLPPLDPAGYRRTPVLTPGINPGIKTAP